MVWDVRKKPDGTSMWNSSSSPGNFAQYKTSHYGIILVTKGITNMKRLMMFATMAVALCGCFTETGVGEPINNCEVVLASGTTWDQVVVAAGTRRGWVVEKLAENEFQLTIKQRSNICIVKVVTNGSAFSILPVESNISVAKYNQWANNLRRAIIACATK